MVHSPMIFVLSEVYSSSFKNLYYTSVFDKLGKMSPGQMFPGQMSLWQLSIVKENHGKLPLKIGQNRMSKSRDIAVIEFPVVVVAVV